MKLQSMPFLESAFPSDRLRQMRALIERMPAFSPLLGELIQVWFVVDASVIQGELRWRLGSRRNPDARSSLHESIESGLFVAIAPVWLKAEIEEHLEGIAADEGVSVEAARAEWVKIESQLHFYRPRTNGPEDREAKDPDDVPYKLASNELGLPVYSKDSDFRAMQVPVIAVCLDLTARKYARAASITTGVMFHSTVTVTFAAEALGAFCRIVKSVFSLLMRLPRPVQLALVGLVAGLLVHPKSRARLVSGVRSICSKAAAVKPEILATAAQLIEELSAAQATAQQTRAEILSALPSTRKRSALMHARAILLTSKEPLSIGELERRIRNRGYVSQARDFKGYLRRILRQSEQAREVSSGLWELRAA
ncbi:MAG: hypothetical protein LAP21_27650 [Acidobacteriia bacterium]|nr:hypothetical protein [Terriglobia bacterium]